MTAKRTRGAFERGREKLEKGEFEGAARAFTEAIATDPMRSEAFYLRAIARAAMNDSAGSESDFANALETSDLEEAAALIHTDRGVVRLGRGDAAGARLDFERAVKLDPKSERAREQLRRLGPS